MAYRKNTDNSGCGCLILIFIAIAFIANQCNDSDSSSSSSTKTTTAMTTEKTESNNSAYLNSSKTQDYSIVDELSEEDKQYEYNSL